MAIDRCLITAAGMGTRMGIIGKSLPKILWPVFDTNLLKLQVAYALSLGVKKIYLNGHFLSPQVAAYIEQQQLPVTFIHEDILLDVGGAIYNIANLPEVNYRGNLLVLNGDQFLFYDQIITQKALKLLAEHDGVLLGISVPSAAGYRQTVVAQGELVEITPPLESGPDYQTYSGVSFFNLERIERKSGVQSFFHSIADYKTRKIAFIPLTDYSYWDFGTTKRYQQSIRECLAQPNGSMAQLIDATSGWQRSMVTSDSYRAPQGIINMGNGSVRAAPGVQAIILANEQEDFYLTKSGLYYYQVVDEVSSDA